jgi:hypothetical protein
MAGVAGAISAAKLIPVADQSQYSGNSITAVSIVKGNGGAELPLLVGSSGDSNQGKSEGKQK